MRDSLGDRMKRYERAFNHVLPPRMPVIVRVDGKAFHTYTRGLDQPFSFPLMCAMDMTAAHLCEQVQTTQFAYVQSDEINLLLHPYKRYASQPWFANELQKIVSVAASTASAQFTALSAGLWDGRVKPAAFDARAFVLPESEVCNYFIWRQQDAVRNSIQMLARSLASHKECHKKNSKELQELCWQRGHNWNDLQTHLKRGRCVVREGREIENGVERRWWVVDREPPTFTQDREYVERFLAVEPENPA